MRLRYEITQELGHVEWVWNVERGAGGMVHVQAWQRGDFLAQARLSEMAVRRGFGPVADIRRWRSGGEEYALKEAYAVKESSEAVGFLERNGGRLTHQSSGFFGMPIREAERLAVARHFAGDEQKTWQLVSVGDLTRAWWGSPLNERPRVARIPTAHAGADNATGEA